jgi:hypothetical protein
VEIFPLHPTMQIEATPLSRKFQKKEAFTAQSPSRLGPQETSGLTHYDFFIDFFERF